MIWLGDEMLPRFVRFFRNLFAAGAGDMDKHVLK